MNTQITRNLALILGLAFYISLSGCESHSHDNGHDDGTSESGEEAVDPHDKPLTAEQKAELKEQTAKFADAVAKLKVFRDAVEEETAGGIPANPFPVHQALDKADLLLQWLPEIARDSEVPKDKWEMVTTNANDLRTLFEQVHQRIDEKQAPDFAAVANEIDAKISELETVGT